MLVSCFFFHLFTFNLVCSLYIKWVSFKQYRVGFYFLFNLKIFGLIGVFKSLIFNVLKYMVALKSTILLYLSVPHILCYFFLLFLTYFGLYFFMVSLYLICRLIGYNCFLCYFRSYFRVYRIYIFNLSQSTFKWNYILHEQNKTLITVYFTRFLSQALCYYNHTFSFFKML